MQNEMTAAQFLKYWLEVDEEFGTSYLEQYEESIAEREGEVRSEIALFGDAGPGMSYRLGESKAELAKIKSRIAQLQGRA